MSEQIRDKCHVRTGHTRGHKAEDHHHSGVDVIVSPIWKSEKALFKELRFLFVSHAIGEAVGMVVSLEVSPPLWFRLQDPHNYGINFNKVITFG